MLLKLNLQYRINILSFLLPITIISNNLYQGNTLIIARNLLLYGVIQTAVYNHWTGLDWTTGLSLKLRACQYINTYDVFVQLINGAYS